jgi:Zn-dependent protease
MILRRLKLFTLLGIVVSADISWLPVAAFLVWTLAEEIFPFLVPELVPSAYWEMAFAGTIGLIVSVVIREVARIVVASRLKVSLVEVTLLFFGGFAVGQAAPTSIKREALVAAAAALSSVVLGAAALLLFFQLADSRTPLAIGGTAFCFGLANFLLAAFDLLPAYPLSGGRVICAALRRRTGDSRRAILVATRIGSLFGLGVVAIGILSIIRGIVVGGSWVVVIGLLLLDAAETAHRRVHAQRSG